MSQKKSYESTVMRMAGNIMAGMVVPGELGVPLIEERRVQRAVRLARAIVAEVLRTEEVQEPKA